MGKEAELVPEEEAEAGERALARLREKLAACEKERGEYLAGWQRARADLVNARKEDAKRLAEREKELRENLVAELVPVLDALDAALSAGAQGDWRRGVEQIRSQIFAILARAGVEPFDPAAGEPFDPAVHESVGLTETPEGEMDGSIASVLQRGYRSSRGVIRPAKVTVFGRGES